MKRCLRFPVSLSLVVLILSNSLFAQEIGFYLLKDSEINAVKALERNPSDLPLEENPFWTVESFQEYRCPHHEFKLTPKATAAIPKVEDVRGTPFVLKVSGKVIYVGGFFSFFSNETFPNPVIDVTTPGHENRLWKLYRAYPNDGFGEGSDPRTDAEFINALRKNGKLLEPCRSLESI